MGQLADGVFYVGLLLLRRVGDGDRQAVVGGAGGEGVAQFVAGGDGADAVEFVVGVGVVAILGCAMVGRVECLQFPGLVVVGLVGVDFTAVEAPGFVAQGVAGGVAVDDGRDGDDGGAIGRQDRLGDEEASRGNSLDRRAGGAALFARGEGGGGGAGVSRSTAPRLRNGPALQGRD